MTAHEPPDHLAHDLFLLMLTLSQLRDPERTVSLFVEGMNAMQSQIILQVANDGLASAFDRVPISTTHNRFGYISLTYDVEHVGESMLALTRNAIRMLAVVLENQKRAHQLADENMLLEVRTAELHIANEELQVLSRLKDEFVTNVSHELRTPITNLVLREHLMRRFPAQWEQHLSVIERETMRLSRIIEDLLVLSRMERGMLSVERTKLDLNLLVERYVADRASLAAERQLTVVARRDDAAPLIYADEGLIEQALSILLTNAFNYTPEGGRITVAVRQGQMIGHDWVGIMVSDTGLGIASDELPHLFDRFFRGNAAHRSGAPGTGLGLAILKRIVDQHEGEIDVESDGLGEGTTFTVWLPVE